MTLQKKIVTYQHEQGILTSWSETDDRYLALQTQNKQATMVQCMVDISECFANFQYLKASVYLHSQPRQRSEVQRLNVVISNIAGKIRKGLELLKEWDKSAGDPPVLAFNVQT